MKKYQVKLTSADVIKEPRNAELETELLFGEIFMGEEKKEGWVQGFCKHDQYEGWIKRSALSLDIFEPTHFINVSHTLAYAENKIESLVSRHLVFASQVNVIGKGEGASGEHMSQLSTGEWVMTAHLVEKDTIEADIVKTAMKFLNVPYHWGGRSGLGIDCSGLTQICLACAGIKAPRNTNQQITALGTEVPTPKKGDLVFFKGHVAIMYDDTNIIHAVGDKPRGGANGLIGMITRIEPLESFIKDREILAIKRL